MLLLGSHMSVAGGLSKAFGRIASVGGTALQIFTRNQRQWSAAPIAHDEAAAFAAARVEWGDYPVAAHASYLINLASAERDKARRACRAFADELVRCERLAVRLVVIHPGSHLGRGAGWGVRRVAALLDRAIGLAADDLGHAPGATVLLETTAGQGTNLGATFAELGGMIAASDHPDRLGVCLDTAHVFAAGYDLRTPEACAGTMDELDREVGIDRLGLVHLNDTPAALGSRRDRHEHIGLGGIGQPGFAAVLGHPALRPLPMILETPKEDDLEDDRRNLALLRRLAGEAS